MEINKVYNFFFHPLSVKHSSLTQVLSTVTIVALSVLTSGIFLLVFGIINLKKHQIQQIQDEDPKISEIRSIKIYGHSQNQLISISKKSTSLSITSNKMVLNKLKINQDKLACLKLKHKEQIRLFATWADENNWKMFTPEYSHYDWWAFPISRSSVGQGEKYAVNAAEIEKLKSDAEFMKDYRRGVQLVVQSWGWDLEKNQPVQDKLSSQVWSGYGVRLGKMADSLYLFGEKQLYLSLQQFFIQVCEGQRDKFPIESWVMGNLFRSTDHM